MTALMLVRNDVDLDLVFNVFANHRFQALSAQSRGAFAKVLLTLSPEARTVLVHTLATDALRSLSYADHEIILLSFGQWLYGSRRSVVTGPDPIVASQWLGTSRLAVSTFAGYVAWLSTAEVFQLVAFVESDFVSHDCREPKAWATFVRAVHEHMKALARLRVATGTPVELLRGNPLPHPANIKSVAMPSIKARLHGEMASMKIPRHRPSVSDANKLPRRRTPCV